MKRVMIVHGMKRSGNHAIINWITAQDRCIFFNNIIHIGPILKGKKEVPPAEDIAIWLQRKFTSKFRRYFSLRGRCLIVSLEDHGLQIRPFRKVPVKVTNILILRDPYNLFSSRIRKSSLRNHPAYPKTTGPAMQQVVDLWKKHAREYLRETNFLENKVCIYFNAWFSAQAYRREISRELNIEFTDQGFAQISTVGGGSSFNSPQSNNDNLMMDVLNRQNHLTHPERHLLEKTLEDVELHALARRIEIMNQCYKLKSCEESAEAQ